MTSNLTKSTETSGLTSGSKPPSGECFAGYTLLDFVVELHHSVAEDVAG